jgi:hypothetical protein
MLRHQTNGEDPFDERGLLKDGHVARVRMTMRDGKPTRELERPRVTDSFGRRPGNRPGFIVDANRAARDAKARAYAAYELELGNRWRTRDDDPPTGAGSHGPIGQREGDLCTINGFAGVLRPGPDGKLVCVVTNNKQSFNGSNGDDNPASDSIGDAKQRLAELYAARDAEDANAWRRS